MYGQAEKGWRALMLGWQFLRLQLSPATMRSPISDLQILHETAEFIISFSSLLDNGKGRQLPCLSAGVGVLNLELRS